MASRRREPAAPPPLHDLSREERGEQGEGWRGGDAVEAVRALEAPEGGEVRRGCGGSGLRAGEVEMRPAMAAEGDADPGLEQRIWEFAVDECGCREDISYLERAIVVKTSSARTA